MIRGENFTVLHRKSKSGKSTSDFVVSANMAYGQVKLEGLRDESGEYEDPDKLARSERGGGNYEFPIS